MRRHTYLPPAAARIPLRKLLAMTTSRGSHAGDKQAILFPWH